MEEVIRECTARRCFRVLIEERLEGPRLGTIEVFGMVSKGSARFQGTLEAMAYVDLNAEGDVMRFAEDVAVNRGFPVKVFPTVAAAEEWLVSLPEAGAPNPPRRNLCAARSAPPGNPARAAPLRARERHRSARAAGAGSRAARPAGSRPYSASALIGRLIRERTAPLAGRGWVSTRYAISQS